MPPPTAFVSTNAGIASGASTRLPSTALFSIVSTLPKRDRMPPASAKRPFGAETRARFPVIVLFRIVSVAKNRFEMPPPSASLATSEPATLFDTVTWSSVSVPPFAIPPPSPCANGHGPPGHGGPIGAVSVGAARLPVTTLSRIVTTAPPESLPAT